MPTICGDSHTCVEKIDQHLDHVHQIGHGTMEMQKNNNNKESEIYQKVWNFSKIQTQFEEEVSQEEESDKNKSGKEEKLSKKVNRKVSQKKNH